MIVILLLTGGPVPFALVADPLNPKGEMVFADSCSGRETWTPLEGRCTHITGWTC